MNAEMSSAAQGRSAIQKFSPAERGCDSRSAIFICVLTVKAAHKNIPEKCTDRPILAGQQSWPKHVRKQDAVLVPFTNLQRKKHSHL
jgi:hypothetical protein